MLAYDDLRTDQCFSIIKKQSGEFHELAGNYGFHMIKEIELLCQQMVQL